MVLHYLTIAAYVYYGNTLIAVSRDYDKGSCAGPLLDILGEHEPEM
jgi:hypothetical protein